MTNNLFAWVWDDVLTDYTSGLAVVLADSEAAAWEERRNHAHTALRAMREGSYTSIDNRTPEELPMRLRPKRVTGPAAGCMLGRWMMPVTQRQAATIPHLQNREENLAHRLFNLRVEIHLPHAGFCHGNPRPMEFRATRGPGYGARKAQQ